MHNSNITCFSVEQPTIDKTNGLATLKYSVNNKPTFEEIFDFGEQVEPSVADRFSAAINILAVTAATSYYKTVYGAKFEIRVGPSAEANPAAHQNLIELANALVGPGLAELRFSNNLQLDHTPEVLNTTPHSRGNNDAEQGDNENPERGAQSKTSASPKVDVRPIPLTKGFAPLHSLTGIGGGKDSFVAAEILRRAGREVTFCSVNARAVIEKAADAFGAPLKGIKRKIDPRLIEANKQGAINGHIPITAITSAALAAKSVLVGADEVVFANEASASEPTFVVDGYPVNHQYSKSWAFEQLFSETLNLHGVAVKYFSVIRPLSEVAVAKILSTMTPAVHSAVASCNRNFHIDGSVPDRQWCADCAKCAFVFLALAPFVGRQKVVELFDADMLADPKQQKRFVELAGERTEASLECIGTAEESQWAFGQLVIKNEWHDSDAFADLAKIIDQPAQLFNPLAVNIDEHQVPADLMKAIEACLN